MKIQKETTLNATYLSVLLVNCIEDELCLFNSTLPSHAKITQNQKQTPWKGSEEENKHHKNWTKQGTELKIHNAYRYSKEPKTTI
jgi:hypothetical protein